MRMGGRTKLQYWLAVIGGAVLGVAETGAIDIGGESTGSLITLIIVSVWGAIQSHYDKAKLDVTVGEPVAGVMGKVAQARLLTEAIRKLRKK